MEASGYWGQMAREIEYWDGEHQHNLKRCNWNGLKWLPFIHKKLEVDHLWPKSQWSWTPFAASHMGPLEQWMLPSKCSKHWLWNMMFGSLVGPNYQRPWQHTAQPCKCWNSNAGDSFHILSPSSHLGMLQPKKSNNILINKSVKQFEGSLWYTIFGLLVVWGDPSIINHPVGKGHLKINP